MNTCMDYTDYGIGDTEYEIVDTEYVIVDKEYGLFGSIRITSGRVKI